MADNRLKVWLAVAAVTLATGGVAYARLPATSPENAPQRAPQPVPAVQLPADAANL